MPPGHLKRKKPAAQAGAAGFKLQRNGQVRGCAGAPGPCGRHFDGSAWHCARRSSPFAFISLQRSGFSAHILSRCAWRSCRHFAGSA
jgi:hypothetical protein